MSKFVRENRYLVAKVRDIESALSAEEQSQLSALINKVELNRSHRGKAPLECVVVESDWPNYQDTWNSIEALSSSGTRG